MVHAHRHVRCTRMWSNLCFADDEEEGDESVEEIDPLSDEFAPEDSLPPLKKILNFYTSDSSDNRYGRVGGWGGQSYPDWPSILIRLLVNFMLCWLCEYVVLCLALWLGRVTQGGVYFMTILPSIFVQTEAGDKSICPPSLFVQVHCWYVGHMETKGASLDAKLCDLVWYACLVHKH